MSGLEGLSIGANVIGVLVFGLQAAKFIAESVSKYQDAEDDHRRFLDAIQRLAGVLTDVNEILKTDEDKLRYSRLYTVAKKCEDDLIKIHDNILEWTGDDRKEQKAAVGRIESNIAHVSDAISNIEDTQVETLVRIDKVETNITQQIETNSIAVRGLSNSVGVNFTQVNGTLDSIDSLVKLFANNQVYKACEEREKDEFEKATGRIFQLGAAAVTRREAIVGPGQTEKVLEDLREVLKFAKKGHFSILSTGIQETNDSLQKSRKISGLIAGSDNLTVGYDHQAVRDLQARKSALSATNVCQWEQEDFVLRAEASHPIGYSEDEKKLLATNRLEIARYLIGQGSDVTQLDYDNYDPFSAARAWGNYDGVAILLESGANPMIRSENILSFARNLDEASWNYFLDRSSEFYDINDEIAWGFGFKFRPIALLHAIIGSHTLHEIWRAPYIYPSGSFPIYYRVPNYNIKDLVWKLVRSGASITSRTPEDGENCLHIALRATSEPTCQPNENGLALLKDFLLFLVGEIGIDVRALAIIALAPVVHQFKRTVAYAIDMGNSTTILPSNCELPCDDFEFFEMLALRSEEMENLKPSSDALVSNWARILEDWESIDIDDN
ncbi:hypothetical protein TWF106_007867 [Orbilia oligospora]|uniref:Fungal N-terminal domain-containing protein n=1 Tax=Orbilia oligospora TaxID=2813651 RepID=A0A7C8UQ69_ORBOL|nr:hypothetical protein TWF106_007867 [Orbilia oligospora]